MASGRRKKKPGKKAVGGEPTSADAGTIILPARSGIKNIGELRESLLVAQGATAAVTIDAAQVESIDTAALQLLVAYANSVRKGSRTLKWTNVSAIFRETADLCALSAFLGVDSVPKDSTDVESDDDLCPVF